MQGSVHCKILALWEQFFKMEEQFKAKAKAKAKAKTDAKAKGKGLHKCRLHATLAFAHSQLRAPWQPVGFIN